MKGESTAEKVLKEIMTENFPNLARNINLQTEGANSIQDKSKEIHA